MLGDGNADTKLSEKTMEKEEDRLRTVECLRGRLLAERNASRIAKDEAELMGKKLIELETKLREETKSRNKAEKKLKFLIKKLESKNITYVSDENSQDIECQESVGSTKSSYVNVEKRKFEENNSINLEKDGSQMSISSQDHNENLSAKTHYSKSSEFEFTKSDVNSLRNSIEGEEKNGESEMDFQQGNKVDNSLALVVMDVPKQTIDPMVLDATVIEVLDGLRHAKEKLQNQMGRRQLIKGAFGMMENIFHGK